MRRIGGLLLVGLLGCDDGDGATTRRDAGRDALADAQPTLDAALDAAPDASDATPDAAPDAGPACLVGEPVAHPVGDWQVQVDPVAGGWAILPPHAGAPVLRSPPACTAGALDPGLALTAGEPVVNAAFGGFRFDFRSLDENLATGGVRVEASAGGVVVHHDLADGTSAAVRFEPYPGGGLRIALDAEAPAPAAGSTSSVARARRFLASAPRSSGPTCAATPSRCGRRSRASVSPRMDSLFRWPTSPRPPMPRWGCGTRPWASAPSSATTASRLSTSALAEPTAGA